MKKLYTLLIVVLIGFVGKAQIVNIPDANFKNELLISNIVNGTAQNLNGENISIDANGDGQIQVSEALEVSFLNVGFKNINDLTGIAYFTNLKTLDCSGNAITSLNVSTLTQLETLNCEYGAIGSLNLIGLNNLQTLSCQENNLSSLIVTGLINLTYLRCDLNNLTSLNVSGLSSLTELQCDENQLTTLTVSGATQLQSLHCKINNLTSLNLTGLVNLTSLDCSSNQIASLNLSGSQNLMNVYCSNNLIISLDIRELPNISIFSCAQNLLTTLYLNNGSYQDPQGSFGNNATLTSVCIDSYEAAYFQTYTCTISTTCSPYNYYFIAHDSNFMTKLLASTSTNGIAKDSNGNSIKIDSNNDSLIDENEIANVYQLDVSNANISDMYGIKRFTHLTKLVCKTNQIQSLDLTDLTALTYLDCSSNSLTGLNTTTLINLQTLLINNNSISAINLAANVNLITLNCSNNQFATLNINALINLVTLNCSANSLATLNVETLASLTTLNCSANNLTSLYIKNGVNESSLVFSGNAGLIYVCCDTTQVTQVQSLITSYGYTGCTLASSCTYGGTLFADPNFNTKLLQSSTTNQIAKDITGNWAKIDANNNGIISTAEAQNISYLDVSSAQINMLSGISNFTNLKTLICSNNQLTSLNISTLTLLRTLDCSINHLETLNVNGLTSLITLNCSTNNLIALTVSGLISLQSIDCNHNQIIGLNATGLTNLQNLNASTNQLQTLNVTGLTGLLTLSCGVNLLPTINVSSLSNLQFLSCSSNQLSTLNVNTLVNLQQLYCDQNLLPTLTLSGLTNLQILDCKSNLLASLNLNGLTSLQNLNCSNNQLTNLNLTSQTNLHVLNCSNNQLPTISVTGLIQLQDFNCSTNQIATLNLNGLNALQILNCDANQFTSLSVNGLPNLQSLSCNFNQLQALDVSGMLSLNILSCNWNTISTLNLTGATNLQIIKCNNNSISTLNLNGLTQLYDLECNENSLSALNVAGLNNLQTLQCYSNTLTALDLSGLIHLYWLDCQYNQITTLNLNGFTQLWYLECDNNLLTSLFMKNGHVISELNYYGNPTLEYICVDEEQITAIEARNTAYGYTNCAVNSYCSFVPGGTFYTIQGNTRFDLNNNGCDAADISVPNQKLTFTSGTLSGSLIANQSGAYSYPVQSGTHIVTPNLETPSYYNVSPASATVSFPTVASPFIQNFCITANGVHNDLEVVLLPIETARPGFDAMYKIIYKNKGTGTQSGTVNLAFDDARLDFISAVPSISSQATNSLSWNFSNLLPFETREILVTLNVNSPIETPSVNAGDVLTYTASVIGANDDTPNDNASIFNQTIVNALDPNDKTCTEGTTVSPSMVGQYVHYVIRFENDGTANAQNIVVKDMIDTTKFDVTTLVPLSGSASYTTRITNTNQVEFIFENINLPFVSGTNTGYVAFKIKTKPTLVLGDTFSNTANIYFDYNAPIVTNTATTTIATLGTQDFDFGNVFTLAPVPAKNSLTITTKQNVVISSLSIYNTIGQLVQVIANPSETIDVSGLQSGSYFIRISSDKGSATGKFIKE